MQINHAEELFDLFDSNRHNPTKYILTYRGKGKSVPMTLRHKMMRKVFYENSCVFDDMVVFAEVRDLELAKLLKMKDPEGDIAIMQNVNSYSSGNH